MIERRHDVYELPWEWTRIIILNGIRYTRRCRLVAIVLSPDVGKIYGIRFPFRKPTNTPVAPMTSIDLADGATRTIQAVGFIRFKRTHGVYRANHNGFMCSAMECVLIAARGSCPISFCSGIPQVLVGLLETRRDAFRDPYPVAWRPSQYCAKIATPKHSHDRSPNTWAEKSRA